MSTVTLTKDGNTLQLSGVLNSITLNSVWKERMQILTNITNIDVSKLTRVDSAGLALLTQFCVCNNLKLIQVNPQLQSLIGLYDLDPIVM